MGKGRNHKVISFVQALVSLRGNSRSQQAGRKEVCASNCDLHSHQPKRSAVSAPCNDTSVSYFHSNFHCYALPTSLPDEASRHIFWTRQEHFSHGCGFNESTVVHSESLPSLTLTTAASAPNSSSVSTVSSHQRHKLWSQHIVAAVTGSAKG